MNASPESLAAGIAPLFAPDLVDWQRSHGRNHLPWQNTQDPYRVWLSEIMLQQTQVSTVLDYYQRFLLRFPTVSALASAHQDEVLGLWSGLGYYSRARNLHRCAQQVVEVHGGKFPTDSVKLQTLPGIGPSTAAAIASFCFAERVAILDGNVKRVLTRLLAFSGDLSESSQCKQLQALADSLLPAFNLPEMMPRYTQGLMDLGATVCNLRKPMCPICPVKNICLGFASGRPEGFPVKTRKIKRSKQHFSVLWAQRPDGSVWLERRPPAGIWGGLYCLPVFESEDALRAFLPPHLLQRTEVLRPFLHVLTHRDLYLAPVIAGFSQTEDMPARPVQAAASVFDANDHGAWFEPTAWPVLGLPAPIRKLLLTDVSSA
jgi:A/G-specific adenine glycosylase